nr:MAG TPA: hypothetical protein [Caudoviricetes sp.]
MHDTGIYHLAIVRGLIREEYSHQTYNNHGRRKARDTEKRFGRLRLLLRVPP